tara:strand:- start:755 stop:901 length:147 start_codon:yes stop_codon:yes gene_type:complete
MSIIIGNAILVGGAVQNLSGGVVISNNILTEANDNLVTEALGDNIILE